jgi:hypothetical protein
MWGSNRQRSAALPIVGPSGSNVAPDFATFLNRQFDARTGAFQVLKRFPSDLNRRDSQEVKDGRVFVH